METNHPKKNSKMPDPCTITITAQMLHDYPDLINVYGYQIGDLIYCSDLQTVEGGGTLARDHERPTRPPHNG